MGEEDKLKMEEKLKEKEISTEDDIDKPELTPLTKFCARHGINPNLIMLKITLFVMYGGKTKRNFMSSFLFKFFFICSSFFFSLIFIFNLEMVQCHPNFDLNNDFDNFAMRFAVTLFHITNSL